MKRLKVIGLVILIALALGACGGNEPTTLSTGTWGVSSWNQARWSE